MPDWGFRHERGERVRDEAGGGVVMGFGFRARGRVRRYWVAWDAPWRGSSWVDEDSIVAAAE